MLQATRPGGREPGPRREKVSQKGNAPIEPKPLKMKNFVKLLERKKMVLTLIPMKSPVTAKRALEKSPINEKPALLPRKEP